MARLRTIEELLNDRPAWVAILYFNFPIWLLLLSQALVIRLSNWFGVIEVMLKLSTYVVFPFFCAVSIGLVCRIIFNGRRRVLYLLQALLAMLVTYAGFLFPLRTATTSSASPCSPSS